MLSGIEYYNVTEQLKRYVLLFSEETAKYFRFINWFFFYNVKLSSINVVKKMSTTIQPPLKTCIFFMHRGIYEDLQKWKQISSKEQK